MTDDALIAQIKTMDREFQHLTGREAFGYVSKPTKTTTKVVFQDGHVCLSMPEGHAYMTRLLATAVNDPAKLPYPWDQDLPPEQDLRLIHGWKA